MSKSWDDSLGLAWTNMVWPSRPSVSELCILKKYADILRSHYNRRLKILILGSTPEYRDFAFEENMIATVIDKNPSYHYTINREIRHKSLLDNADYETIIFDSWENIEFENEFDLIVGDLVIGNVIIDKLPDFLKRISDAMTKEGIFIQKSIYSIKREKSLSSEDIVREYYKKYRGYHAYSYLTHAISMNVVDDNHLMKFDKLYNEFKRLHSLGLLEDKEMQYIDSIGLKNDMGFTFYMIPIEEYERLVLKYFNIYAVEHGLDIDSKYMPTHILTNKKSILFGGKI